MRIYMFVIVNALYSLWLKIVITCIAILCMFMVWMWYC